MRKHYGSMQEGAPWLIHARSGGRSVNKLETASTRTLEVDRAWRRHVSLSDRIRSTHRLPLSLAVPRERLRQSTPKRNALSARLFVGSTPHWLRNTHSESISRSRRRVNRPASSCRS